MSKLFSKENKEAFAKPLNLDHPILVQVLGKPKARIMMPVNADAAEMEKRALADEAVRKAIDGRNVVKVIAVPKRMVNIVVK